MVIEEGSIAPEFSLLDESGKKHSLADYRGKPVVIYFYPKDDTPGCTTEACEFRNDYERYVQAGVVILGISPDTSESHTKFKTKYQLPFTLLADTDHQVCLAYGVWGRKKFMGKEYDGVFRTTFVVDGNGKIVKVFRNVKPNGHSNQVLGVLDQ